jgi:MoaA/NifB/PqqE/SkfB family radical SAM enzyme
MVDIKKKNNLKVTIGMQMVVMPEYADQLIPLAKLGKELRPDYLVFKHCSDDEDRHLGVQYSKYKDIYGLLKEAESYSDSEYKVAVKWSKIEAEGKRSYQRCYGTPFLIQISGTGLVSPCSIMFNEKYKKYHLGNICEKRFKDIIQSDEYWEVMNRLASPSFNAQTMCGTLCLQHKFNEALDNHVKGIKEIKKPEGQIPQHVNFV